MGDCQVDAILRESELRFQAGLSVSQQSPQLSAHVITEDEAGTFPYPGTTCPVSSVLGNPARAESPQSQGAAAVSAPRGSLASPAESSACPSPAPRASALHTARRLGMTPVSLAHN